MDPAGISFAHFTGSFVNPPNRPAVAADRPLVFQVRPSMHSDLSCGNRRDVRLERICEKLPRPQGLAEIDHQIPVLALRLRMM